jgi:hypothetical protein
MGRLYTASFKAIAVTAAQDLIEILGASDSLTIVRRWVLSQTTEVGDAQEEGLLLTTNRGIGAVTSGSGGGSITAQPVHDGDAAFGGTIERNNTSQMAAGSGSLEELETHSWNVRVPYDMTYLPEDRPVISPGNRWTLELETVPADSITMNLTVWLEELGG